MIQVSPFPDGRDFAVTFVDDTDGSTRANTQPVYEFLRRHNIGGTKTVWVLRARRNSAYRLEDEAAVANAAAGATLEDEDYREFVLDLQRQGFEIGLHGIAGGNSRREEIIEGLQRFAALFGHAAAICAFHQTNIENLYCGRHKLDSRLLRGLERLTHRSEYEGHVEQSPYFWGDLARRELRYVRLPFHTIAHVDTLRVNPAMPFHDPRRPYVPFWFASSDGANVTRFNRLLSARNLDRLKSRHGACVIYTHLAKGFAVPRGHTYELNRWFVATVERLAGHETAWLPTASQMLDRLAVVRRVSVRHRGLLVRVTNQSDRTITGLTLRLAGGLQLQGEDGSPLRSNGSASILAPLDPGRTVTLRANRAGNQTVPAVLTDDITARAHRNIEYRNYLALIASSLRDRLGSGRIHRH